MSHQGCYNITLKNKVRINNVVCNGVVDNYEGNIYIPKSKESLIEFIKTNDTAILSFCYKNDESTVVSNVSVNNILKIDDDYLYKNKKNRGILNTIDEAIKNHNDNKNKVISVLVNSKIEEDFFKQLYKDKNFVKKYFNFTWNNENINNKYIGDYKRVGVYIDNYFPKRNLLKIVWCKESEWCGEDFDIVNIHVDDIFTIQ